jgi:NAD(P)-dependent dehydrogenase (short-subunit alcohol dehydrogenase family)
MASSAASTVNNVSLRAGDRVVATGRNLEKVRGAYGDSASENIASIQLDVADAGQTQAAVDSAIERFGPIDVQVNNAGYSILNGTQTGDPASSVKRWSSWPAARPRQGVGGGRNAMSAVTPVVEARLEEIRLYADLSKSTDGAF